MASSPSRPTSVAASDDGGPFQTPVDTPLATPRPLFLTPTPSFSGFNTPRGSFTPGQIPLDSEPISSNDSSAAFAPIAPASAASAVESEKAVQGTRRPLWRRPLFWIIASIILVVIVLVIALPAALVHSKHSQNDSSTSGTGSSSTSGGTGSGSTGSGSDPGTTNGAPTTGGNGSIITLADGSNVTYVNNFGGFWVADPNDPFNNNAQPNSWTPPLNTSWTWGKDRVYGVNLGGWFVLEPFIVPSLFQKYPSAVDEWTLSQAMANDTAGGGLQSQLENHYNTFITEADFIQIAGAGLNWLRIPIPFWAIETYDGEPFLPRVCWTYILRAFAWARKYGLRIYLDLHTVPGGQNGFNHSGKLGQINFMNGLMGLANAQRTLSYIRTITEFISQPEYRDIIPLFGVVNEVLVGTVGKTPITSFYVEALADIRANITGFGEGNGPYIAVHDGFQGVGSWANYLPGSDRLVLDTHPYFAFDGQANNAPIAVPETGSLTASGASGGDWPRQACEAWQDNIDGSQSAFGVTVAGEFSNAINDCGLFINGVSNGPTYAFDCTPFNEWQTWNASMKSGFNEFILASMDATQNWFFWTWKIGNSSAGTVQAPLWSYKLGLDNGWMPPDPRASIGKCAALVSGQSTTVLKTYTYAATQTGNPAPPATFPASLVQSFPWPPVTISHLPDEAQYPQLVPTYTPTATPQTLPMPSPTVTSADGWLNTADTQGAYTPVAGCSYPNAWDLSGAIVPTAACTGPVARRDYVEARATAAPARR